MDIYSVHSQLFEAVFSRSEVKKHLMDLDADSVHISLYDPDLQPEITNYFNNALYVPVWDLEEDICQYKIITKEQAKEIKNFILDNKDKKFIINCEAGISRSAGAALAVECLIKYDGDLYLHATSSSEIKEHPRYSPNLTIYKMIVEA